MRVYKLAVVMTSVVLLILSVTCVHAVPNIPDTGQSKCYESAGNELNPCQAAGQPFYGQDTHYQPQHPRSYTKLGLNCVELGDDALPLDQGGPWLMTRDNVTGLIWEIKQNKDDTPNYANHNDADNTYTWYDPNPANNGGDHGTPGDGITTFDTEQFIDALNAANYSGFHDWRIPTIKELGSIVNFGLYDLAIDGEWFPGTQSTCDAVDWPSSKYWSSTTYFYDISSAWGVYFYYGDEYFYKKGNVGYVRAVRGGQSGLFDDSIISGRMADNGDGTVTDTAAGLMWQQAIDPRKYTWQKALAYAEEAGTAGYYDWRLPNQNELKTLKDFTRYDPAAAGWYWSSTTWAPDTSFAWGANLNSGADNGNRKGSYDYVRAVRGGQAGSLGHLVISSPEQASKFDIGSIMAIRWETVGLGTNIKISLSRQGGLNSSFVTIIETTTNDGQFDWTVTGPASVNCVIKIEQADNLANWATEGLFIIKDQTSPDDDSDGDGYTLNQGDCNDSDATIYPGTTEICGDGVDQDCNGSDLTANEQNEDPQVNIKANGSDGRINITSTDNLSLTIELSPEGFSGVNADWWLVAATPFGLFHYQPVSGLWASDLIYSYQGPLFSLGEFEVLNISGLPAGSYTIYFGIDMLMNGSLDMGQAYYDSVTVNILL